jgi:hypothetical protein
LLISPFPLLLSCLFPFLLPLLLFK